MSRLPIAVVVLTTSVAGLAACSLPSAAETLSVGHCLGPIGQAAVLEEAPIVDCAESHESEVYAAFELEGAGYPGSQAVAAAAESLCLAAFEDFVGVAYEDSELLITTMTPTRDAWEQQDDREALCLVNDVQDTIDSLRDANR